MRRIEICVMDFYGGLRIVILVVMWVEWRWILSE